MDSRKVYPPKIEPIDKRPPENFGQRLVLSLLRGLTQFLFHLRFTGKENIPEKGPLIVVSNHQSMFDVTALLCHIQPWVYMMAKAELFMYPLLYRFFYWYGAFPVNRQKVELTTAKRAFSILKRGDFLGIFPEGTRVKKKQQAGTHRANSGVIYFAQKMNCPILPVSINKPYRLFRRNRVIIGQALRLDDLKQGLGEKPSHEDLAQELMRRVYALQGIRFEPDAEG